MLQICVGALLLAVMATADTGSRVPTKAVPENSAEHGWISKKVHATRLIDDLSHPEGWSVMGNGEMTFPSAEKPSVRVNVSLQNLKGLPVATARRAVPGEDWREYNRLSFWIRTNVTGIPVLTMMVSIRNKGTEDPNDVHAREGTHNATIPVGKWTRVLWEIPHVRRDSVTALEFRPWVNKRLPEPWDSIAYEIGRIDLERVDPDHYEGWNVAPRKIAFSHTGYRPSSTKQAIASGMTATTFQVVHASTGALVLQKPVVTRRTLRGMYQVLDFTEVRTPGTYILRTGGTQTRPFRIGTDVWDTTVAKTLNFFYGERCGADIPTLHEACHRDWQAVLGEKKIIMNGGWHDAGDLSQGLINTGEATHSMFALAAELRASGRKQELLGPLVEEAKWGLDWIHKVRFPGGYRIGFASMNVWTNGIQGDEDDRPRAALNNPNVNYIAAAAGARAYIFLKDTEPELAKKSLAIAEDDWRYAIAGIESPETQSTPAFAASEMELASIGIIASVELFNATGREEFARKAHELSAIVLASQQRARVGTKLPLSGFFYTGPDRKTIFHQFHRGNDQVPVVALAMMCDAFPKHEDWMKWYSAVALYSEYQKRASSTTAPYEVLPAYVYREDEWQTIAEGDRYGSSREAFKKQVLGGVAMGGGYYLKAFPVWFTRRGNYGPLLSQAKGLSAAARLRNDEASRQLVERQLEWVVGRNPFAQSTMWGEGYDFAAQYSVSVGDIVGSLPVGMMTRENADAPYWPATNTYVFKEVWVHPSARWLSILEDLIERPQRPASISFTVSQKTGPDGTVAITVEAKGKGEHSFTLRTENVNIASGTQSVSLKPGVPAKLSWTGKVERSGEPWVAVVVADNDSYLRRDIVEVIQ